MSYEFAKSGEDKKGEAERKKGVKQNNYFLKEVYIMTMPINRLVGMTPEIEAIMQEQGIHTSDQLLDAARSPADRKALAKVCGVTGRAILALADRADLARIHGVGGVLADLLEHIKGIKTVSDLAKQRAAHLFHELDDLIEDKKIKLVGRGPSIEMVRDWIKQAKALEKKL